MTTEPVSITEALRLLIIAAIVALQAFDVWNPSTEQNAAVLGLYAAVSVVLSAFARQRSTPNDKVALTTRDAEVLNLPPPEFPTTTNLGG
jgi:hypothetical protein